MKTIEIEAWALRILDAVSRKAFVEDSIVELKAEWIDPLKAARRLAGHANAARGASILWLIGADEKLGIVGADYHELSNWFQRAQTAFDGPSPAMQDVNVHYGDKITVPGLTEVDALIFLRACEIWLENPNNHIQVPELFKEMSALDIPEKEFLESIEILDKKGFIEGTKVFGGRIPFFRVSHFAWGETAGPNPFLDVFGVPPRVTGSWQQRTRGIFADRQTVAEMKRTRRRKDWDQATALGLQMLEVGEAQGWLHIFDPDTLLDLAGSVTCPRKLMAQRPVLKLAQNRNPLLGRAVQMEVEFWSHLDRVRLKVYETAGRAYAVALLKLPHLKRASMLDQHAVRLEYAERLLPKNPLRDHGLDRIVTEARAATIVGIDPALAAFLPEIKLHFANLLA